jgi:CAAD domains of cyanobacterial aminoacyl-tRNA synthetase
MDTSFALSENSSENSLVMTEPSVTDNTKAEIPFQRETVQQWDQMGQHTADALANFPFYLSRFFSHNRRAILNTLIALVSIIALKVILAVLDALDDIPLLSPLLQLVGLGYSLWFVNRYLLKAQSRQDLLQQIQGVTKDLSAPPPALLQPDAEFQG